jgi:A/G-specific adenine glycosylase
MNSPITKRLLAWHTSKNTRAMPWKGEKDPYKIWLSEIILQQTRVEQGWDYYNRFVDRFPSIGDLAFASDQEVFKMWEGLGYYSRCKNLLHTARAIVSEYHSIFPKTYEQILGLKGIGTYTAAAIGSFAFGLPYAVVDGNVLRVLARVFGIAEPVDNNSGKKTLTILADQLLDRKNPGLYNQAIMDFGAVICKPAAPLCGDCPFKKNCKAFQNDLVDQLPVKGKKMARKKRWFYYIIVENEGHVLVRERNKKDIWKHLNEFFLVEAGQKQSPAKIMQHASAQALFKGLTPVLIKVSAEHRQVLTHQEINGKFLHVKAMGKMDIPEDYIWISSKEIKKIPFPKFILSYLKENG